MGLEFTATDVGIITGYGHDLLQPAPPLEATRLYRRISMDDALTIWPDLPYASWRGTAATLQL
jgi:hypothetical protein